MADVPDTDSAQGSGVGGVFRPRYSASFSLQNSAKFVLFRKGSERIGFSCGREDRSRQKIKRGGLGHRQPVGVRRGQGIPNYIRSWVFTEKITKIGIVEEGERAGWVLS